MIKISNYYFKLDYVGLTHPILVPFLARGEMAGWKILNAIERVLQSHEQISIHRPVHINVVQVKKS